MLRLGPLEIATLRQRPRPARATAGCRSSSAEVPDERRPAVAACGGHDERHAPGPAQPAGPHRPRLPGRRVRLVPGGHARPARLTRLSGAARADGPHPGRSGDRTARRVRRSSATCSPSTPSGSPTRHICARPTSTARWLCWGVSWGTGRGRASPPTPISRTRWTGIRGPRTLPVLIPRGARTNSVPSTSDEESQAFETSEDLIGPLGWNELAVRRRRPSLLTPDDLRERSGDLRLRDRQLPADRGPVCSSSSAGTRTAPGSG